MVRYWKLGCRGREEALIAPPTIIEKPMSRGSSLSLPTIIQSPMQGERQPLTSPLACIVEKPAFSMM